jgi:[acyl-carrier-protein] S-malonyltransferase
VAVPKRRTSRSKRDMRRAQHDKVVAPNLVACPKCGEPIVGMCSDVVDASPAARSILARADLALGESLTSVILRGPEDRLTLTANAQPALVATSCAVLAAIRERTGGHPRTRVRRGSLARVSTRRSWPPGRCRSRTPFASSARAGGRCRRPCPGDGRDERDHRRRYGAARGHLRARRPKGRSSRVPANFNAPGQIVVAGHAAAVARVGEPVIGREGPRDPSQGERPVPLRPHGTRGAHAGGGARTPIDVAPRFPVVANFDARANADSSRVKDSSFARWTGPCAGTSVRHGRPGGDPRARDRPGQGARRPHQAHREGREEFSAWATRVARASALLPRDAMSH